jgi:hypothetical protein
MFVSTWRFSANPCDPACLVFSHKFKPQLPAKNFCRALQDFERHAARLEPCEEPHGRARIGVARVRSPDLRSPMLAIRLGPHDREEDKLVHLTVS